MINLFIALYLINVIIMTTGIKNLTNYGWVHCIFIGILTGGPLMFMGIVKVFDFIAMGIMEISLMLGGSSTKEVLQEFVKKYENVNKSGRG